MLINNCLKIFNKYIYDISNIIVKISTYTMNFNLGQPVSFAPLIGKT